MNNSGRLIVISGPSGVGKGTVLSQYMARHNNVWPSVSATTRAPRPGEENGVHYQFLTAVQFQEKIDGGGMLEWAQYNGNFYGTPRDDVEKNLSQGKDVVLEIEVQGALQVKKRMPEAVLIFVMPPSFQVLSRRLYGRGTEEDAIVRRRLRCAREELRCAEDYDYIVVNDDLDKAVQTLETVIEGSKNQVKYNKEFMREVLKDAETDIVAN